MKYIKRLLSKKGFSAKKLAYLCCGNCKEFEPSKKKEGWGFCPGIYWPYNILSIKEQSFCRNFELKKRLAKEYEVSRKSRPKKEGLIERITTAGIRKRSAMISDSIMM